MLYNNRRHHTFLTISDAPPSKEEPLAMFHEKLFLVKGRNSRWCGRKIEEAVLI
jgi:hypothetical protein